MNPIRFVLRIQYQLYYQLNKMKENDPKVFVHKKVGKYSFSTSNKIGKGYSSQVYKGINQQTNQHVAIKVIDMEMLKSDLNQKLLNSQIEILKKLRNRNNVLHLYDVIMTKNNTYLITELCVKDMNKVIKQANKLNQQQAVQYFVQILTAYQTLYQYGIIHRDLKPANLLINTQNQVKIADFGFAIYSQNLTGKCSYNVGSPLFMAPQSLKNSEYSFKTDIWSLGIIFFQLLTGKNFWNAKDQKQLMKKVFTINSEDLINEQNFKPVIHQFLVKSLKRDIQQRMNPEQIAIYRQKLANQLSTRKSLINSSNLHLKNQIPSKVHKRRKSSVGRTSTHGSNQSQKRQSLKKDFGLQSQKLKKNSQKRKIYSNILVSQVHFCRFLFKLLQRLKQAPKYESSILSQYKADVVCLEISFTKSIRDKLGKVINFDKINFLNIEQHTSYAESKSFQSLKKIAEQYCLKYSIQLPYWSSSLTAPMQKIGKTEQNSLQMESTLKLIMILQNKVQQKYKNTQNFSSFCQKSSFEIILLDYFVTCFQLFMLASKENYETFSNKSRIEQIIGGANMQITENLYRKINQKATKVINAMIFN